jgi:MraZ protein
LFRGISHLNLDVKGRIAMPSRYRDRLLESGESRLIATIDSDGCLLLYPHTEWDRIEQGLMKLPSLQPQVRRLQRLLLGHATECDMDTQGRMLLPAPLREFAGLEKHVVLVGQGNKFELWNESAWTQQRATWIRDGAGAADLSSVLEQFSI